MPLDSTLYVERDAPMKRGLKQCQRRTVVGTPRVERDAPMKRGLKQSKGASGVGDVWVERDAPMKRGLKLHVQEVNTGSRLQLNAMPQ